MMNILITTSSFGQYDRRPFDLLTEAGFSYSLNPFGRTLTREEFLKLIGDSVGVIAGTEPLDVEDLKKIPTVKAISRCGVGLDNVDLVTAKELSIVVTNTPDCITVAVAELTVGLILALLRKTLLMDKRLKEGKWQKMMGYLLSGKNIGVIGFGRIGQKVGELLSHFDAKIGFYDTVIQPRSFARYMALEELCHWADIICMHAAKTTDGKYLLDKTQIDNLKDGAWLVNCARGGVVNENALYEALVKGKLSGAALDVFEEEPYQGPLLKLENIILTPHIGSYAKEARVNMELEAVKNLLKSFNSYSRSEI